MNVTVSSSTRRPAGVSLFAVVGALTGGLLLLYGWKRRTTWFGRMTSTAGMTLLAKALANPRIVEMLGPMQSLLSIPLAAAQKLLV